VSDRPPAPRRPEPLDVDAVKVVTIGTVLWGVAFVALVPFWGRLSDDGHGSWLWTCLAGLGLGLLGIELCRRMRVSEVRARERAERKRRRAQAAKPSQP
jgi:hypothetical protein